MCGVAATVVRAGSAHHRAIAVMRTNRSAAVPVALRPPRAPAKEITTPVAIQRTAALRVGWNVAAIRCSAATVNVAGTMRSVWRGSSLASLGRSGKRSAVRGSWRVQVNAALESVTTRRERSLPLARSIHSIPRTAAAQLDLRCATTRMAAGVVSIRPPSVVLPLTVRPLKKEEKPPAGPAPATRVRLCQQARRVGARSVGCAMRPNAASPTRRQMATSAAAARAGRAAPMVPVVHARQRRRRPPPRPSC